MAYRVRDQGVVLRGLDEIQSALRTIDRGAYLELRKRLRDVGEDVAGVARGNVRNTTGRHFGKPPLRESIKVTVAQRSAAVYSVAPHGGVQNVGGRVGRNRATLLKRADVSAYMNRAVSSQRDEVEREMDSLLDWVEDTFGRGR